MDSDVGMLVTANHKAESGSVLIAYSSGTTIDTTGGALVELTFRIKESGKTATNIYAEVSRIGIPDPDNKYVNITVDHSVCEGYVRIR